MTQPFIVKYNRVQLPESGLKYFISFQSGIVIRIEDKQFVELVNKLFDCLLYIITSCQSHGHSSRIAEYVPKLQHSLHNNLAKTHICTH